MHFSRTNFALTTLVTGLLSLSPVLAQTASMTPGNIKTDILANLKPTHPRLIVNTLNVPEFVKGLDTDEEKSVEYKALLAKGTDTLKQPVMPYNKADMLATTRKIQRRIQNLSFLFLITRNKAFLDRARLEMLSAAAFPDWNPDHFLDTAELTNGLALGYDWLYNDLSEADRNTIRTAIINKGLIPLKDAYDHSKYFWVQDNATNWNQVCNGSAIIACLSLSEQNSDAKSNRLIRELAPQAFAHFQSGMKNYAPDGGWDEGPGYWHLATTFAVRTIASLESATGSDFDLSKQQGFSQTGDFALAMIAPSGKTFNFADATGIVDAYPEFFWLAKRFNRPYLAWRERDQLTKDRTNISAFDMLWYSSAGKYDDLDQLPTSVFYGGNAQVVAMRSSWNEIHSAFVAAKGGNNASHHAHLDLGTFIYEFDGIRWVEQLGGDNYDLPGYFNTRSGADSPRWKYYRLSTAGQNVVLINKSNQDEKAIAPVTASQLDRNKLINFAIIDLSQANKRSGITSMQRGISLLTGENRLVVQDEIKASKPVDCQWQVHTQAQIEIAKDGREATLRLGDHQLSVSLVSPDNARFTTEEVKVSPPEQPTQGVRLLKVELDKPAQEHRVAVLFAPFFEPETRKEKTLKIIPLETWATDLEKIIKGDTL